MRYGRACFLVVACVFALGGHALAEDLQKALATAVRTQQVSAVQAAIARGAKVTPVLLVSAFKSPDVLALLVKHVPDVNAPVAELGDMTPLGMAVMLSNAGAVEVLLAAGADAQREVKNGKSALDVAKAIKAPEVLAAFARAGVGGEELSARADRHALLEACRNGDVQRVAELLRRGVSANQTSEDGETPLHVAAARGHTEVMVLLLDAGADANAPGKDKATPLMRAASSGDGRAVQLMLRAGANVDARDAHGQHAITHAGGVDDAAIQIEAASPELQSNRNAVMVVDGGEYEPGTRLRTPCGESGGSGGPVYRDRSGTYRRVSTKVVSSTSAVPTGAGAAIGPPECRPLSLGEGEYQLLVTETSFDWNWLLRATLRETSGAGKDLYYSRKSNSKTTTRMLTARVGKPKQPSSSPSTPPPTISIVRPVSGDTFAFDRSAAGVLELALEASVSPPRCEASTTWDIQIGTSRITKAPSGAADTVIFTGLPRQNASFGPVTITARSCGQRSAPVTINVFYPSRSKNHPPPGTNDTPNWFYYWGQTRAAQGKPVYVEKRRSDNQSVWALLTGTPGGLVLGQYDYGADKVVVTDRVVEERCHCRVGNPVRGRGAQKCPVKQSEGIDCYAEIVRHENHHRRERWRWWGNTNPAGLMVTDPQRYRTMDRDRDLVPDRIEEGLAAVGCDPDDSRSCRSRPSDDLPDGEMNAYAVGWQWVQGAADQEDWSLDDKLPNCGNAKWKGRCPPPNW